MITIEEQIKCVEREIKMREWVYPMRIESGKMTKKKAKQEIDSMKGVLNTLKLMEDQLTQQPSFKGL